MRVTGQEGAHLTPLDAAVARGYSDMRSRVRAVMGAASVFCMRSALAFLWYRHSFSSGVSLDISHVRLALSDKGQRIPCTPDTRN
jgi:hypothetical protein